MRCPHCRAEIGSQLPEECPECRERIADPAAEATQRTAVPDTGRLETVGSATERIPSVADARMELATAAGFAFVALIATGAVLALAGKLQFPELGSGADPVSALTAVVMTGLAVLGATVHIGELTVSATPLGAVALVGVAGAWATSKAVRSLAPEEPIDALRWGLAFAVPFAAICWVAGLIFRIRNGPTRVAVDGTSLFLHALLWGAVFGVIGALWAFGPRVVWKTATGSLSAERAWLGDAARLAVLVLAGIGVMGSGALLLWIIGALLAGGSATDLGFGGLFAAGIYVIAFAPNLVLSVVTISLGAPVRIGAAITQQGRQIGAAQDHSLFTWPGGSVPWWVYLLLAIPLVVSVGCGLYIARTTSERRFPHALILVVAATVAVALYGLSGVAEARLGAGLVRSKGVALAAPSAWAAGILAFVWVAGGSAAAWFVERRRQGRGV